MQQNENRGRANWKQYQTYRESLSSHIKLQAESLQNVSPIKPDFHFQRASCCYAKWIKTISFLVHQQVQSPTGKKIVAASVELMADDLYKPENHKAVEVGYQLVQGVLILKHLDSLNNLLSTFEITNNNPAPNQEIIERAHSVDFLHNI
ncbi:uncharacterized protein VP01_3453g4 [Puccinia sorghi]|uniref:Uncharacterized protein n=1 Tax=Puccinia sorghi TaxID=27349 RepID=A0A0L6UY16_9BASI|nr:uncharacterized protein VP01_3453g4 [Puccinia sorghi]